MTKARDLSKLLSTSNGKIAGSNLDVSFENISDTGTEGTKVASGTTAQRGSTTGQWRFNTTTGYFEGRNNSGSFSTLEPTPTVTSVDVTEVDSTAGGTQTFVITGTNFSSGGTISFIGLDGTEVNANSTTYNSATQVTVVEDKTTFSQNNEPYKIKFTSSSGLAGISGNGLIYQDQAPNWSTSAGNVGNVLESTSLPVIQLSATDPDGDTVTYTETTSTLSGAGFSLSSSGAITGNSQSVSGDTTTTFDVRATANGKTADRTFNIVTKNLNSDALLFDATNINNPSSTNVYTSNADGASVGLALENGNSISVNTAVQLSRINGVTNGTLANGKVITNQSNLLSHYNNLSPYGEINYGNTFWGMSIGDPAGKGYNNGWFGIYYNAAPYNGHIWWTWDVGDNPSFKLKRMTGDWTWRTGGANFKLYGSNSAPNSGNAMQSSFVSSGLTEMYSTSSLGATFDYTLSNTAYYRYYVFRLENTSGTYDYGIDMVKWYGDYY